jgi:hypothetical protein
MIGLSPGKEVSMKTLKMIRLALAAAVLSFAGLASAQNITGQVVGRILDADTGKPIAGATVTASSPGWIDQSVTTDAAGYYVVSLLPPARYTVAVKAIGYGEPLPREMHVPIDWRVRNDVQLMSVRASVAVPEGSLAQKR